MNGEPSLYPENSSSKQRRFIDCNTFLRDTEALETYRSRGDSPPDLNEAGGQEDPADHCFPKSRDPQPASL
jgi:hypothetical protein